MGQLLTTKPTKHWYQSIVSIRNYSEPDFEDKLFKYGSEIFENFYVVKFKKFTIYNSKNLTEKYQPDLLLVSKKFDKWIFVEVELVKPNMGHTYKQIDCFLNPDFKVKELVDYILKNPILSTFEKELTNLVTNYLPGVLIIFDSHSTSIFKNINIKFPRAKICVFEVHKSSDHIFEAYRISGEYPYDITNSSKLIYFDDQHYTFSRPDIITSETKDDIYVYHDMEAIPATLIKGNKKKDWFLKIADNPFSKDSQLQFSVDTSGKYILQRL